MKIRDKLYLSAGISVLLVIILVFAVFIISDEVTKKNQELQLATEIQTAVSELDILTYEYLLFREKRMEQQWNTIYNSGAKIIRTADKEKIKTIRANYVDLGRLFLQVTVNYKKVQNFIQIGVPQEKIDAVVSLEERLVSQLLIKSLSIISESSRLSDKSLLEITETQKFANNLTLFLMIFLAITIITTSLVVARNISKPLHELHRATEIFEEGKLDYRIKIKTKEGMKPKDEIEQVSHAFNNMAAGLESRSKEAQKELTKRKKAEEKLENRVEELEKFHKFTIDRELKMIELKKKIKELESEKLKNTKKGEQD